MTKIPVCEDYKIEVVSVSLKDQLKIIYDSETNKRVIQLIDVIFLILSKIEERWNISVRNIGVESDGENIEYDVFFRALKSVFNIYSEVYEDEFVNELEATLFLNCMKEGEDICTKIIALKAI